MIRGQSLMARKTPIGRPVNTWSKRLGRLHQEKNRKATQSEAFQSGTGEVLHLLYEV
jgi:hypothetical protein